MLLSLINTTAITSLQIYRSIAAENFMLPQGPAIAGCTDFGVQVPYEHDSGNRQLDGKGVHHEL